MGRTGDEGLTEQDTVAAVLAALDVVPDGAAVVLAVSGGPDSAGLAQLVVAARPDLRATVVHVRHGLRDDAADARAAAAVAQALGLPVSVVQADVGAGAGPEDAARQTRLDALLTAAVQAGAGYVLTGHTADDQAETVLLNIARGAGLPGLAGMPHQRPLGDGVTLLHPLLRLRRAAVRAAAAAAGLPVVDDPTNTDAHQRRARARTGLLPALSALSGGDTDPVVALERLARHARRDTQALDDIAAEAVAATAVSWGPVVALPADLVDGAAAAIAARVVRLLVQRAGGGAHPPPTAAVDAVLALPDGRQHTMPGGVLVSRGSGWLAAVRANGAVLDACRGALPLELPQLGLAVRSAAGAATDVAGVLPPWSPAGSATSVAVADPHDVHVRARRPGDRIATAAGTQVIADAMVAAGVPRVARGLVPVISDAQGPLWVPGVAVRAGPEGGHRLYLAAAEPK